MAEEKVIEKQPTEAEIQEDERKNGIVEMDPGIEEDLELDGSPIDLEPKEPLLEDPKSEINQDAINKKFDTLTFKKKQAEEAKRAAEQKATDLEKRIAELEGKSNQVKIPDPPDPFDDDYSKKLAEREAAIIEQARIDAQSKIVQEQQLADQVAAVKAEQQSLIDAQSAMYKEASKQGVEEKELREAEDKVAMFVKDVGLAKYILNHEKNALLVKVLAADIETLDTISKLDPVSATALIVTGIVPKLVELEPKPSKTPDPINVPGKTKGTPPAESPFLKGVTFE